MPDTYLDECLKDGRLVRWPAKAMPIRVYIAPFRWYEKKKMQESNAYNQMVLEAMSTWSQVSGGIIRFRVVSRLEDSQMDVKWRRVDRKSLGHCEYMVNQAHMIYSAEISIGISDGIIHSAYNDSAEVKHTILHEFGHALGLVGHSKHPGDIMYVPHQFGVVSLSERDMETLRWLYKLPEGFDYHAAAANHNVQLPYTIHDVIDKMAGVTKKSRPEGEATKPKTPPPAPENPKALLDQQQILTDMGKFHMATQHIKVNRAFFERNRKQKQDPSGDNAAQ